MRDVLRVRRLLIRRGRCGLHRGAILPQRVHRVRWIPFPKTIVSNHTIRQTMALPKFLSLGLSSPARCLTAMAWILAASPLRQVRPLICGLCRLVRARPLIACSALLNPWTSRAGGPHRGFSSLAAAFSTSFPRVFNRLSRMVISKG